MNGGSTQRMPIWLRPLDLVITVCGVFFVLIGISLFACELFYLFEQKLHTWPNGLTVPSHTMPEEDFLNLWAAGTLARQHGLQILFDPLQFQHWRQIHFGLHILEEDWIYTPSVIPLGLLLSYSSLSNAFVLWLIINYILAIFVLRVAGLNWSVIILTLLSPASIRVISLGQYGMLMGALVTASLLLVKKRPVLAGTMIAFVTLKPQPGLIVPVAFVAGRYWRALLIGIGITLCLCILPTIIFGYSCWTLYLRYSVPAARHLIQAAFPQPIQYNGASVFWMVRSFGGTVRAAYVLHALVAAVAIMLVYNIWRRNIADLLPLVSITVILSMFISPYAGGSDMVGFTIAVICIAKARHHVDPIDILLWLWPFMVGSVTQITGHELTPIALAVAVARGWPLFAPSQADGSRYA